LQNIFNIDVVNAHRAEDDARVCMEVFLKLKEIISPEKTEEEAEQPQPEQQ